MFACDGGAAGGGVVRECDSGAGIRVYYCTVHLFSIFFFLKKKTRVLAVSLPCPCRVRKNIKILDTSFGVSDTDFRVSDACPCPTRDTQVQWCVLVFQLTHTTVPTSYFSLFYEQSICY